MNHVSARTNRYGKLMGGLVLAMLLCVPLARAQQAPLGKNDVVYLYRGADRDQRLVEKARQEARVVWYTSMSPSESTPMAQAFEKKYGIKVELWRASSGPLVQRVVTEGQARRFVVDVIETTGPEMEMIGRENLLSKFFSPHFADLQLDAIAPNRLWVTDRLNFFVVAFNTNKFKREDMPKHYEGFLDPKWKGQIGIEATDAMWMATIIKKLGTERGMKLFEKLAEMRPDVRKSHILLAELVSAGEVPVALTVYNSQVESLKRRGGPIEWMPVEPIVGLPVGIGVAKNAPNPHAALLFADFVLSPEGQELFNAMGRIPSSLKVKSNLKNFPYVMTDPVTVLDESEKWETLWNKLFLKK